MLKRAIVLLLLLSMSVTLFGCGENKPDGPHVENCDCTPPPLYFGFGEEIQFVNYDKYIKFESFEICDAYENLEPSESGSGYYAILGVSTNLTEIDFADRTIAYLATGADYTELFHLRFRLFDANNARLVLEIQQKSDTDYARLMTLKIEDHPIPAQYGVWPCISFEATNYYYDYVSAEGVKHFGKEFRGQLKWGS